MDSTSNLNFYGLGTNEWLGIILSFESQKEQLSGLSGWGWRYKVAIMGFHPNDNTVSDEEITYALCALGTCDGTGAAGRMRTPRLSSGDVVLGKFLDGDKRQIPLITNVLGRTTGIRYGTGRFESKSGFVGDLKPGLLERQEFNENDGPNTPQLKENNKKPDGTNKERKVPKEKIREMGLDPKEPPKTESLPSPPVNTKPGAEANPVKGLSEAQAVAKSGASGGFIYVDPVASNLKVSGTNKFGNPIYESPGNVSGYTWTGRSYKLASFE